MADKLPHFEPGSPAVWGKLNELVDRVNAQDEEIADLRAELAGKQDKRATKSTTSK